MFPLSPQTRFTRVTQAADMTYPESFFSNSPARLPLKICPLLSSQTPQPLLPQLREQLKCFLIILIRSPHVAMYKSLERVPEVRSLIPALCIPIMCPQFLVCECNRTRNLAVDLIPVAAIF